MRALGVALALAVLAGSALGSCNCSEKKSPPQAQTDRDDDDGSEGRARPDRALRPSPRPRPTGPGTRVRNTAPLTLADAVAAMPPLDARSLGEPAMSPTGNQARFIYCIDADSVDSAGNSVKAKLEASGWTRVSARPPSGAATSPRFGVAGQKDDLRMSVTVQAVRRTGCDASVDQYFTVVSMNRMAPGAPDEPTPPPAPPTPPPAPPNDDPAKI